MYATGTDYDYAPIRPALDTARMMAVRAVALDSTLPETRTALAVFGEKDSAFVWLPRHR